MSASAGFTIIRSTSRFTTGETSSIVGSAMEKVIGQVVSQRVIVPALAPTLMSNTAKDIIPDMNNAIMKEKTNCVYRLWIIDCSPVIRLNKQQHLVYSIALMLNMSYLII